MLAAGRPGVLERHLWQRPFPAPGARCVPAWMITAAIVAAGLMKEMLADC